MIANVLLHNPKVAIDALILINSPLCNTTLSGPLLTITRTLIALGMGALGIPQNNPFHI
jgi:hypothetical protein